MREFMDRLKIRFAEFMEGRYGTDDFNKFLLVLAIIVLIAQLFTGIPFVSVLGWLVLILVLIRSFSKNFERRQKENEAYLNIIKKPRAAMERVKKRKTTVYLRCSGCKTRLSVPRGKGKIRIICPKCGKEIYRNT